jgi:hypothetical protein
MLISLAVGYRVYLAGLAAVAGPAPAAPWLIRPGEAGVALVLGLAAGGWLAGVWLGERRPRDWVGLSLVTALLAGPLTQVFYSLLGLSQASEAFAIGGLAPGALPWVGHGIWLAALMVGGLAGAWWAALTPGEPA